MWGTRWGETAPVHRHEEFLAFENTSTGEATNHLSRRPQDLEASQHARSVAMNGSDSHPTRPGFPHSPLGASASRPIRSTDAQESSPSLNGEIERTPLLQREGATDAHHRVPEVITRA